MGVQNLWLILEPASTPIKQLQELNGQRLAVDTSIWLYSFAKVAKSDGQDEALIITGFFYRILKLLHFGIRPIFVFDGRPPEAKRRTMVSESANSIAQKTRAKTTE
jgi:DNA excision repair protein ERCC-5